MSLVWGADLLEPRAVRIVPNDPPAVITAADHIVKGVLVFDAEGAGHQESRYRFKAGK